MSIRKSISYIVFVIGISHYIQAQTISPKYTFNVELGLPVAAANMPFKAIMQGLVTSNVYLQHSFPSHFNLGVGAKYTYFVIDEFSVSEIIQGGIHSSGAFVKFGFDKFYNEQFALDVGIKFGYNENFFVSDINKALGISPVRNGAILIEPTLGLILAADRRNSYRLNIGYTIQNYGFRPTELGLDSNLNYNASELAASTQFFFVGFGYTYYFGVNSAD